MAKGSSLSKIGIITKGLELQKKKGEHQNK